MNTGNKFLTNFHFIFFLRVRIRNTESFIEWDVGNSFLYSSVHVAMGADTPTQRNVLQSAPACQAPKTSAERVSLYRICSIRMCSRWSPSLPPHATTPSYPRLSRVSRRAQRRTSRTLPSGPSHDRERDELGVRHLRVIPAQAGIHACRIASPIPDAKRRSNPS